MSTQSKDNGVELKFKILQWLQREYAGKKIGKIFNQVDLWMVSSYFEGDTILVLGFAQGRREARIRTENIPQQINIEGVETLEDFKKKFIRLLRN